MWEEDTGISRPLLPPASPPTRATPRFQPVNLGSLTRPEHPTPVVRRRVHTLRLGQMCRGVCPSSQNHTEHFHCPKLLCAAAVHPSVAAPSQPLQPLEFLLLWVFSPFVECHINAIAQYGAFSDGLLWRSNVHLRCLDVFSWLESSFLLIAEWNSVVGMDPGSFTRHLRKDVSAASKRWRSRTKLPWTLLLHFLNKRLLGVI